MENTTVNVKNVHEPLFHLVKRDSIKFWQSWLIRIGAVLAALIVVAIIAALMGYDPLSFYKTMFEGSFGSKRKIWKFLQQVPSGVFFRLYVRLTGGLTRLCLPL